MAMDLRPDPSKRSTWFSLGRTKLDDGQTEKMRRTLHWPLLCHWPLYSRRKFEANGEQQNDRRALWPHKTTQREKNHGTRVRVQRCSQSKAAFFPLSSLFRGSFLLGFIHRRSNFLSAGTMATTMQQLEAPMEQHQYEEQVEEEEDGQVSPSIDP